VAGVDGHHTRKKSGITFTGTSPRFIAWRGEVCLYLRMCDLLRAVLFAFSVSLAMMAMASMRGRRFVFNALWHNRQFRRMG